MTKVDLDGTIKGSIDGKDWWILGQIAFPHSNNAAIMMLRQEVLDRLNLGDPSEARARPTTTNRGDTCLLGKD